MSLVRQHAALQSGGYEELRDTVAPIRMEVKSGQIGEGVLV